MNHNLKAIDLENGNRVCTHCHTEKTIQKFGPNITSRRGRRVECRSCQSLSSTNKFINERAEKNPQDFFVCNDCDRVMHIHKRGRPRSDGTRRVICKCKYCGSKNIDDYLS